jgi:CubicO group peptidase (beta-lactamase class C family)
MSFTFFPARRLMLACVVSLGCAAAHAENWPGEDWDRQLAAPSAALSELENYAFPTRDDVTRQGVRTDALLVIRDGQVVYERYAAPTTAATPHLTWSIAKSLLATVMKGVSAWMRRWPSTTRHSLRIHRSRLGICSTGRRAWTGRKTMNMRR